MADAGANELDTKDSDVKKFFQKGQGEYLTRRPGRFTNVKDGADLKYEKISEKDATVLRRILSTGPPVKTLTLCSITLSAFKAAFDELYECPWLKRVYLHIDCEGKSLGTSLSLLFRGLQILELSCENTGTRFAKDVASYIRQNKSLKSMVIWDYCGGDGGAAALIEALRVNDTLAKFAFAELELSSEVLICFANMLVSNSTLEIVKLRYVCPVEKEKVCSLLAMKLHAGVFKRLDVVWPVELLPELNVLIRRQACCPVLCVSVASSVDEKVLWEFSDALAADTALRDLTVHSNKAIVDALEEEFYANAGGNAFEERKRTLREIWRNMGVNDGKERHLISILDALKKNCSVKKFTMLVEMVTPDIATSLSELLTVNNTLNEIDVSNFWEISPREIKTILRGLRNNYTLTDLVVNWDTDDLVGIHKVHSLLQRNLRLVKKAAEFVISSAEGYDEEGADAFRKLHTTSDRLVEKVQELTGKTTEASLQEIQSALARLSDRSRKERRT
ncbi:hypothetical protein HPB52_014758 [Rhipicephalus sanguineus]|uniref:Uncharacterized protein n=1 Tax=Rhipicephalus sanguineus TaxID=34632 RepID=A0A9D4QEU8_RHISA|nr:hypothetical protein HPB52_014758 [Rhipicephalus sanguineus]